MKFLKRSVTNESLQQLDETYCKKPKIEAEGKMDDVQLMLQDVKEKNHQKERCQICLWPLASPQCYHLKKE